MKQFIKRGFCSCLNALGYEILKSREHFTIAEIRYEVDPCSLGRTGQGEMTAEGAMRMIKERKLHDLSILDICCGVGIVGLTIYSRLRDESIVRELAFADINIFNINSLKRTIEINNLDELLGNRIKYWLSDGLNHIPPGSKFDIIISNPPHFVTKTHSDRPLTPGRLGSFDADWSFHKAFYGRCHEFLTERGEVWFLECSVASYDHSLRTSEGELKPFIEANPKLEYIRRTTEPLDTDFFWMITRKAKP